MAGREGVVVWEERSVDPRLRKSWLPWWEEIIVMCVVSSYFCSNVSIYLGNFAFR